MSKKRTWDGSVKTMNEREAEQVNAVSDTPLTNAVASAKYSSTAEYMRAMTMHARYLEREWAAARLRIKTLEAVAQAKPVIVKNTLAEAELRVAQERIAGLEVIAKSSRADRFRRWGGMERVMPKDDVTKLSDSETEELFASIEQERRDNENAKWAKVAEQEDATDLKSVAGDSVPVRSRPLALLRKCALLLKR